MTPACSVMCLSSNSSNVNGLCVRTRISFPSFHSGRYGPLKPWCSAARIWAASKISTPPSKRAWPTSSSSRPLSTTAYLPPASPTPWGFTSGLRIVSSIPDCTSTVTSIPLCCVPPPCASSWWALKCWVCRSGISRPKPPPNNCARPASDKTAMQRIRLLALLLLVCVPAGTQVITVNHGPNAAVQQTKPYVVLVSLDGFRYDYAQKYGAGHLLKLAAQGAIADQGMIPAYPSLTFPNHYTLVTGP